MKLCFICDIHLPECKKALQYDVLEWALSDALEKKADCIIFAGDITSFGNYSIYKGFVERMNNFRIPVLYIPGNSDLRDKSSYDFIKNLSSPTENKIGNIKIFALNDCDNDIKERDLSLLDRAEDGCILFLHHPINELKEVAREKLLLFIEKNKNSLVFHGHKHKSYSDKNVISLQALDPDKAIGEPPCITYYNTDTRVTEKAYYKAPLPLDFYEQLGISCYRPTQNIRFAISHRLKNIELRNNILKEDASQLKELISEWREVGGKNLCVHLSDVGFENGTPSSRPDYIDLISLAKELSANRVTQHVPRVSVNTVKENPKALENIAAFVANAYKSVGADFTVGIENMHMTSADNVEKDRRFGYLPDECLLFMELVASEYNHKVGINFDIGHARNNPPFYNMYPISSWLSIIGKYTVGYHFHQVTRLENKLENHMPITELHSGIINYTSFFKNWSLGNINKVPVILEMRPEDAYAISLETLKNNINK